MTLSVSHSKSGAVIRGEVQFGQVLLVNFEEAYNLIHRDINKIQEWAPNVVSCSILDNRFESWEVGARRRAVIGKAPYKDVLIREILTEKQKSESRAHATFTYSPVEGEELSFSALRLDSCQKYAKCMAQKGPMSDPEAPNISESMHAHRFGGRYGGGSGGGGSASSAAAATTSASSPNKYSNEEVADEPVAMRAVVNSGGGFAPSSRKPGTSASATPSSVGSPTTTGEMVPIPSAIARISEYEDEAPTLLSFKTTYNFSALSGGIATTGKAPQLGATAGELRCFMEILIEYTLSCETPGEHDQRLLYDHTVLREFLQKFWVRELAESFANYAHAQAYHLTDGYDPLRGPTAGYGAIRTGVSSTLSPTAKPPVLGGPSDARVNAVADQLGLRFAEEHAQYDTAVSQLSAKAKTAADDQLADTMLKMLASWERVTGELKKSQEMVERISHELDAAKLITDAATGFNSSTERGRVVYDFEENKRL